LINKNLNILKEVLILLKRYVF